MSIVTKICFTEKSGKEIQDVSNVELIANKGIVNDRYFHDGNDKDKMVPLDKGKLMVEKIKNSELEVIKECGHMIIFEKAFEMREIVKNFVEKNHKK